jgi:hypothetical protein
LVKIIATRSVREVLFFMADPLTAESGFCRFEEEKQDDYVRIGSNILKGDKVMPAKPISAIGKSRESDPAANLEYRMLFLALAVEDREKRVRFGQPQDVPVVQR